MRFRAFVATGRRAKKVRRGSTGMEIRGGFVLWNLSGGRVERCVRLVARRGTTGGAAALAVLAVGAVFPEALHACPVCFDRDDEARIAFLATTGLLTLLPLGLVVGTGVWLRRRARAMREGAEPAEAGEQEG